jgi:hypothetical protein
MKLKSRILSTACALACAAIAGQAQAALPGGFAPEVTVYLGGATAPDNFLNSVFDAMFDAGYAKFRETGGIVTNYRAFYGTVKSSITTGGLGGKKVLFIKRSRGGSVWGVNPVARAQRMEVLDVSDASCASAGTDGTGNPLFNCGLKGTDPGLLNYSDPGNQGIPPDFGVSDVEANMFKGPYNVEFGQTQLTDAEASHLAASPVNTVMMGMVTTRAVPNTTYLSRAAYGAMLLGLIKDWSKVDPTLTTGNTQVVVCRRVQGSGTQASYNWFFANFPCQNQFSGAAAPTRMTADSAGWQTDDPVGNGFPNPGDGSSGNPFVIDPTLGYTVVENPGSGDVRNCLDAAYKNTKYTFKGDDGMWYTVRFDYGANNTTTPGNPPTYVPTAEQLSYATDVLGITANYGAGPFRAIGVLSVDSAPNVFPVVSTHGAVFHPLDGVGYFNNKPATNVNEGQCVDGSGAAATNCTGIVPSKNNLLTARYDFAVELAMQKRNTSVTNDHGDVVPAPTGLLDAFVTEFIKQAGAPANNANPWVAAVPSSSNVPTVDSGTGIPTGNIAVAKHGGNTCKPLQKLF